MSLEIIGHGIGDPTILRLMMLVYAPLGQSALGGPSLDKQLLKKFPVVDLLNIVPALLSHPPSQTSFGSSSVHK